MLCCTPHPRHTTKIGGKKRTTEIFLNNKASQKPWNYRIRKGFRLLRQHGYSGGDQQGGRHWKTKEDSLSKEEEEPDWAVWSPSSAPEPQMDEGAEVLVYSACIVMAGVAGCLQQLCIHTGLADCRPTLLFILLP